jgi:hypothetical protein
MKAIISQLWNTGIEIITTENDENEIKSFADLRKCNNVLVEKRERGVPSYVPVEVLIDERIVYVSFRTVSHPTGCGKLRICEIN